MRRHMAYVICLPDTAGSPTELDPVNGVPVSSVPNTYFHKS